MQANLSSVGEAGGGGGGVIIKFNLSDKPCLSFCTSLRWRQGAPANRATRLGGLNIARLCRNVNKDLNQISVPSGFRENMGLVGVPILAGLQTWFQSLLFKDFRLNMQLTWVVGRAATKHN